MNRSQTKCPFCKGWGHTNESTIDISGKLCPLKCPICAGTGLSPFTKTDESLWRAQRERSRILGEAYEHIRSLRFRKPAERDSSADPTKLEA